jgi:hypothetical protein
MVEIVATDAAFPLIASTLLSSMPAVGPVLACSLITLLPELGRMSRKRCASQRSDVLGLHGGAQLPGDDGAGVVIEDGLPRLEKVLRPAT